jgi:hypothetical protein
MYKGTFASYKENTQVRYTVTAAVGYIMGANEHKTYSESWLAVPLGCLWRAVLLSNESKHEIKVALGLSRFWDDRWRLGWLYSVALPTEMPSCGTSVHWYFWAAWVCMPMVAGCISIFEGPTCWFIVSESCVVFWGNKVWTKELRTIWRRV